MAYQALARKYRPSRFTDLVGQESVARALAGSIDLGRIHPAIIFSGVRGIGKTTTARLYAKALNCDQGTSANPCGKCESCIAIALGTHEDVLEIDGASNNGVDEVRALRESVGYVTQRSPYKVYIIDEVHMLSGSAFNALLKTLEEPPPNVIFLFATTEIHKVPQTVVGRCLLFNLLKMTVETIADRIRTILDSEGVGFDEEVLIQVAKEGHGSMRDALTFLDQLIAVGQGRVSVEAFRQISTAVDVSVYFEIVDALLKKDAKALIGKIEELDQGGATFADFVEETARFVRHAFIVKELADSADITTLLPSLSEQEVGLCRQLAASADLLDLNRIFRTLMDCRKELEGSEFDRFVFENYLIEWCLDPGFPDIDALLAGVAQGEGASRQPLRAPAPGGPVGSVSRQNSLSQNSLSQNSLSQNSLSQNSPGQNSPGQNSPGQNSPPGQDHRQAASTQRPKRSLSEMLKADRSGNSGGASDSGAVPAAPAAPAVVANRSAKDERVASARADEPSASAPSPAVPGSAIPGSAVPGSAVPGAAVPGAATRTTVTNDKVTSGTVTPVQAQAAPATDGSQSPPPRSTPVRAEPRQADRASQHSQSSQSSRPQQPQASAAAGAGSQANGEAKFPSRWRDLVDIWKIERPLQARKLEEVHPLKYGPDLIEVAVGESNMVGDLLLSRTGQADLQRTFAELFGFTGVFRAVKKDGGEAPKSILQDKQCERQSKREKVLADARNHGATRAVLDEFSGRIDRIEITNPALVEFGDSTDHA